MISKDILKQIRQIEIHTKRLLSGSLVGQSSSAVKGSGFEFDQIREYLQGDDVRFIDWKSSVRMDKLMVRQYIEERSRCIMLIVDVSASSFFNSGGKVKHTIMSELAATLTLAADYAKDRVSLLLFSDVVELFIPAGSGQKHVRFILEQLFTYKPKRTQSSLKVALEHVAKLSIKDAVVFLISDFIVPTFDKALHVITKKYDVIAIRCLDKNEYHMPSVGLLPVIDDETGITALIDTRSDRSPINAYCKDRLCAQNKLFSVCGVDLIDVKNTQPYIRDMVRFFKKRMLY